ncbi:MAG: pseudouridine-5'-phosphate glycosidase [Spirochaetales bacterium]|nr:pseudouridine-5'-phosphate glycosidase [Spirochaetales bacterium]
MKQYIDYSEEAKAALEADKPVVALESTIISHGMPYPQNLETAQNVENIIREEGATPATMAIIGGRIKVGLSPEDLEFMANTEGILKASRRDFPSAVAMKQNAATTVATTMICARLAGIRVFATGGIGGVHRGAEKTFDISADLQELAGTNVAVISAGAKSILDLSLTLEYLETMGVPIYGYGTDEFPAFFTRHSGLPVTCQMNTPEEIASALRVKWGLGLSGGVLIANPVPEEFSMDKNVIDEAIDKAVKEAEEKGIIGKHLTPYLLTAIKRLTEGKSLASNIELVYNNARTAAKIAVVYNSLKKQEG